MVARLFVLFPFLRVLLRRLRVLLQRLALAALSALLWGAAACYQSFEFGVNGPDFAAGLGFALPLSFGAPGLVGAMTGWLLCQSVGVPLGLLSDPAQAVAFFTVLGGLALGARANGLGAYPRQLSPLVAVWVFAAVTIALAAASGALLDARENRFADFLRGLAAHWLDGVAGLVLVLVPFWRAPAGTLRHPSIRSGWGWMVAVVFIDVALGFGILQSAEYSAAVLPAMITSGVMSAALIAALGGGIAGVGWQGLLLILMSLALAARMPWIGSGYPAVFALAQVIATVVALFQEQRRQGLAERRWVEHSAEQRDRLAMFELIAENSADIISVHFPNFDFQYVSPQLNRLLGLAADERPGSIELLLPRLHPSDRPQAPPENPPDQGRFRFRIRGGDFHWHWLESIYSALGQGGQRRYVVVTRDIGAHVEQAESLHAMALHDPMTQLYNRRAAATLGERLWEEAVTRRMPFAVIMLDIDHFKKINDTFGHDVGDEAIKRVAAILPEHVRQRDMVCRWGGEEFLMLLPESDVEGAYQIAERVRGEVASTVLMAGGQHVLLRISAGVTQRTEGDATLAEVIERADQGLYAAKEQGRNRVVPMRKSA